MVSETTPVRVAKTIGRIVALMFAILILVWFLFPFYWSFVTSFKHPAE